MRVPVSQLALDYLYCIKKEYADARGKKLSRLSVQWGTYSVVMNRATKMLIKEKHKDSFMLKILYNVWVAYSELLEYHHRYNNNHKKKEKRGLARAIKTLEKVLNTGNVPDSLEKYWED